MLSYHFFGFLWTKNLIMAITMTCIAGAVCDWYRRSLCVAANRVNPSGAFISRAPRYWTLDKEEFGGVGTFPILGAFWRTMRYHVGSLALGAFIIAVVEFLRAVLAYIDNKTKQLQEKNKALKIALKHMFYETVWKVQFI